ncbi:hypothetical protein BDN72DRAFT_863752 [Pluteus cervinus]|uniref:Uncharacterized protein n=1 Tax=Pluteus cervinus TaxID=181527 RepID=A0ACD3A8U7_9AGAR|nr:hypothetical protein BDN72DRAFT_863752 [Pluteus cervinus]
MPVYWTNLEQRVFLATKIAGAIEACKLGRSTRYAKSVHREFSECWPERDALLPRGADGALILTAEVSPAALKAEVKKRERQVTQWLQRNAFTDGRKSSRGAVTQLLDKYRNKSKRLNQEGEMYVKLYPEKVSAAFQVRKDEIDDIESSGARLNFHRKIAKEMFLEETDEVQEEVREALEKESNGGKDGDVEMESGDDVIQKARAKFITEMPDLFRNILANIREKCGEDWGFVLAAAGPMEKPGNDQSGGSGLQTMTIYVGPSSLADSTFFEAYGDVEDRVAQSLGQFVQDCIANKPSPPLLTQPTTHPEAANEAGADSDPEEHNNGEEFTAASPSPPSPTAGSQSAQLCATTSTSEPHAGDKAGQAQHDEGHDAPPGSCSSNLAVSIPLHSSPLTASPEASSSGTLDDDDDDDGLLTLFGKSPLENAPTVYNPPFSLTVSHTPQTSVGPAQNKSANAGDYSTAAAAKRAATNKKCLLTWAKNDKKKEEARKKQEEENQSKETEKQKNESGKKKKGPSKKGRPSAPTPSPALPPSSTMPAPAVAAIPAAVGLDSSTTRATTLITSPAQVATTTTGATSTPTGTTSATSGAPTTTLPAMLSSLSSSTTGRTPMLSSDVTLMAFVTATSSSLLATTTTGSCSPSTASPATPTLTPATSMSISTHPKPTTTRTPKQTRQSATVISAPTSAPTSTKRKRQDDAGEFSERPKRTNRQAPTPRDEVVSFAKLVKQNH